MNGHEQLEVLRSIEILVDTREQPTKRAMKRYERFGCPFERCTLSYGDYSYNATLPDGTKLYDTAVTVSPGCVIERKMSLDELAACFCKGRSRFTKEFERARENDARIYLIVENASWENLLNGKYRTKMDAKAYTSCPALVTGRYCEEHAAKRNSEYEKYGRDKNTKRRYGRAWKRIRDKYAAEHPYCERCYASGVLVPVEEIHHKLPLAEGGTHDRSNLIALCKSCHSQIHAKRGDRWHDR